MTWCVFCHDVDILQFNNNTTLFSEGLRLAVTLSLFVIKVKRSSDRTGWCVRCFTVMNTFETTARQAVNLNFCWLQLSAIC